MQPYRLTGAASAWFAVLAQYGISISQSGLVPGTVIYFAFFTMLGNILVALAFSAPLLPAGHRPAFFLRPGVRSAIGVYILVVAVIFYLLLRKIYHPSGLGWFVNIQLHYINPPLYLLDWALFVPKRELRFVHIPFWLIFPVAYASYTMLHGAFSGFYPYPFLNAATLGYTHVGINIGGLTLLFAGASAGFVATGRYLLAATD